MYAYILVLALYGNNHTTIVRERFSTEQTCIAAGETIKSSFKEQSSKTGYDRPVVFTCVKQD